ncbi:hypothetical protein ACFL5Q_00075 [Planctomycetota bacterium]
MLCPPDRHLRYLIQRSLEDCPGFGARVEIQGTVNRIAEGLWHENYWFWIQGRNLPAARAEQAYILRLLERRYDWQASSREDALVGIVDWEMAHVGDPAYDRPVSLTDVRVHELLLVLHWLEEAWREHQRPEASGQGPGFYENQLRSPVRRAAG